MQENDALFAGETSGHYYFRDNFYADNGMIPLLLLLEYLSTTKKSLAEAIDHLRTKYPVSGEINFSFQTYHHLQNAMNAVHQTVNCWDNGHIEAQIDGLSVRGAENHRLSTNKSLEHSNWRFNLRESNTEPLIRLNVEAINIEKLVIEKTEMICDVLVNLGGNRETKFRWET